MIRNLSNSSLYICGLHNLLQDKDITMYVQNQDMYVQNQDMYVQNQDMYVQNQGMYVQNQAFFLKNAVCSE